VIKIHENCDVVGNANCDVDSKNINMNNDPKNILPNATMFPERFFSKCFDNVNSTAQNRVAARINSSPVVNVNEFSFRSKKFPNNSRIAAMKIVLFSFSFKNVKANRATKINIVLCMKDPDAPDVSCNPLKNSRNGIEPPNNPIKDRFSQSFFFNCLI